MTTRSIPTAPGRPLPAPIAALDRLCHNMYWAWNPTIRRVLRSIDSVKFDAGMSPVQMLVEADLENASGQLEKGPIPPRRIFSGIRSDRFIREVEDAFRRIDLMAQGRRETFISFRFYSRADPRRAIDHDGQNPIPASLALEEENLFVDPKRSGGAGRTNNDEITGRNECLFDLRPQVRGTG